MRALIHKNIPNPKGFKEQLLIWSQQFREAIFLDSNDYPQHYSNYDCVLAVDAFTSIKTDYHNAFEDLKIYQQTTNDWLFGYLSYDLKNDSEKLESNNFDGLEFPDLFFFQPKKIFLLKGNQLEILYLNMCNDELEEDYEEIVKTQNPKPNTSASELAKQIQNPLLIQQRISKEKYLNKVNELLSEINQGNLYEANFCMEFYAENAEINLLEIYQKLNAISEPPFAAYFKNHKHFLAFCITGALFKKRKNKSYKPANQRNFETIFGFGFG